MQEDISWKMRMEHKGYSHLWLSWSLGNIHFDPASSLNDGDIVILLWVWPERLVETAQAISAGKKLIVIASQEIIDWLQNFGSFDGYADHFHEQNLSIKLTPYEGFPSWTWPEGIERIRTAISHPLRVFKRLLRKHSMPNSMPRVAEVTFPSGVTLVHLNLSLHRLQQKSWLQSYSQKCGEIDWLIAGIDQNQDDAFVENLSFFQTDLILVTDLLSGSRKEVGLKTQWLTPIVDNLLDIFEASSSSKKAYVFAPFASFRFNTKDLT